jgi:putative iron-dependent peroxidase
MPEPANQSVTSPLTSAALFLVCSIESGGEARVRDALSTVAALRRAVSFRDADPDALKTVIGIGSDAWDRLFTGPRPTRLHPFAPVRGPVHSAPATPGDLFLHLRANRMDLCFEFADLVLNRMRDAVTVVDETHGFGYFDSRDLLGFVDGTENPEGPAAESWAYTSAADDPDFPGGSYVIAQKYFHDRDGWNLLSVEDQERALGRTKLDNVELADEVKPSNAHTALTIIENSDGEELKIVRRNMPFFEHRVRLYGTYFVGYAADPAITEQMLRNMFLGKGDAAHDRILAFSTAATGGLFFVPPAKFLEDLPAAPVGDA